MPDENVDCHIQNRKQIHLIEECYVLLNFKIPHEVVAMVSVVDLGLMTSHVIGSSIISYLLYFYGLSIPYPSH